MKKYIFYLSVLILAGCTHSGGPKPANTDSRVLKIDWKHISDKLDYAPAVEDSLLMFQLETTDECLIGEVTKLIYQNGLIYIADNLGKRVFVFDTTGKLQADIHRVGNGPGEYTHISYFAVHGTEMVIFDHFLGKFFFFDAEGRFLREKQADGIWTEDLFCMGDKLYLPNSSRTREGCYHLFALDLKEGDKLEKHLPFGEEADENNGQQGWSLDTYHALSDEDALLWFYPYDEVYRLKDDSISLPYKVDFGHRRLPLQYIEGDGATALQTASRDNYVTGIDRIRQSKRYLLLQFEDSENEYFTLYDKETDEMRTTKSLYNSLLGGLPLQQEGERFTIQHDCIIQYYDADFFRLWNTNGHLESEDTRFYTEELRKRFVELARTEAHEGNPIVMIQKIKREQ